MVADRREGEINAIRLEQDARPADGKLAHAALAEAAADDDALGVAPALQAQEAAHHRGEFLSKILDRALHHARRFGITLDEELVELLLAHLPARRVPERVLADLPLEALAPVVE